MVGWKTVVAPGPGDRPCAPPWLFHRTAVGSGIDALGSSGHDDHAGACEGESEPMRKALRIRVRPPRSHHGHGVLGYEWTAPARDPGRGTRHVSETTRILGVDRREVNEGRHPLSSAVREVRLLRRRGLLRRDPPRGDPRGPREIGRGLGALAISPYPGRGGFGC
jgi:hypothetical protein